MKLDWTRAAPVALCGAMVSLIITAAMLEQRGEPSVDAPAAHGEIEHAMLPAEEAEAIGEIVIGDQGRRRAASAPASVARTGVAEIDTRRYPKGLVIAHDELEPGSWVRLSNLTTGEQIEARVVGRAGAERRAAAVLSNDVADRLGFAEESEVAVLIEPLSRAPTPASLLAMGDAHQYEAIETASTMEKDSVSAPSQGVAMNRFLDLEVVASEAEAAGVMSRAKQAALDDGRFGDLSIETIDDGVELRWRVRLGPVPGWTQSIQARNAAREAGFDTAELYRR